MRRGGKHDNENLSDARSCRRCIVQQRCPRAGCTLSVQRHRHRLSGGVLVGATVVATNVETNVESKATTTEPASTSFLLAERRVPPSGRSARVPGGPGQQVTLHAAQTLTLDFKLEVESVTEAVTVNAPVIETSTAEIGQYVSNKEFQTWPIAVGDGQRQIQQFIFSSLPGTTGGTFEGAINGGIMLAVYYQQQ